MSLTLSQYCSYFDDVIGNTLSLEELYKIILEDKRNSSRYYNEFLLKAVQDNILGTEYLKIEDVSLQFYNSVSLQPLRKMLYEAISERDSDLLKKDLPKLLLNLMADISFNNLAITYRINRAEHDWTPCFNRCDATVGDIIIRFENEVTSWTINLNNPDSIEYYDLKTYVKREIEKKQEQEEMRNKVLSVISQLGDEEIEVLKKELDR